MQEILNPQLTTMGRHKIPAELKKLKGTYRKDYDNGVETQIAPYFDIVTGFKSPPSIIDTFCKTQCENHVNFLSRLNVLNSTDIPEIIQMYEALQEYRKIYEELQKTNLVTEIEKYDILSNRLLKFGKRFSELGAKYCMSPTARNKLTLESLNIEKELEQKSIIADLISKKRA